MTDEPGEQLVDVPAAATWFRRPPATIRGWIMRYGVPVRGREGRRNLYSLSDLIDAESRALRGSSDEPGKTDQVDIT